MHCFAQSGALRSPSQMDVPNAYRQLVAGQRSESLDPKSPLYLLPSSLLVWGPVTARPHIDNRLTYGNNLRSRGGSNENTLLEEISPGSTFQIGNKWRADYTATLGFYSSKDFKDSIGHNVSLSGGTTYHNWSFTLSQSYSRSSDSLIETGVQTDQESFGTSFGAAYYLNSKLMLQLGLDQSFRDADAFTSSRTWSTMDWLNYQISSRFSLGAGLGGGYENVTPGSDMTFEQIQAKVNFRVATKIDLAINGGGEIRQILDISGDPLINPIYGASIQYHPFQYTTLSLAGNRTVSASLFQGQVTESTSISVALNQRLLGLLYLTLSGGFGNSRYILANSSLDLNRQDDTVNFAATLSYSFSPRCSSSLFYIYSDNTSSSGGFSYASTQIGLQVGYRF